MVCRLPLGRRYDLDEVALCKPGQLPERVNRLRLSVSCPPSIWGGRCFNPAGCILECGGVRYSLLFAPSRLTSSKSSRAALLRILAGVLMGITQIRKCRRTNPSPPLPINFLAAYLGCNYRPPSFVIKTGQGCDKRH